MTTILLKLDDWCNLCPRLELETKTIYADTPTLVQKIHKCKHADFCRDVIGTYRERIE